MVEKSGIITGFHGKPNKHHGGISHENQIHYT